MAFILDEVEKDINFKITTAALRKAIPKEDGGFKPIIKPALCGELVSLLKSKKLDYPA